VKKRGDRSHTRGARGGSPALQLRSLLTRKMEVGWAGGGDPGRRGGSGPAGGSQGSGVLGRACSVWVGFGDAAERDFEAEGAEFADVVGDLAADVAPALVVVRAEVDVAHAGVGQQLVVDLQLGVPGGDACFGCAASSGQPPVAGAFAGLGAAGCHGGFAGDGAQVPVAFLGRGPALALAGLVVQRDSACCSCSSYGASSCSMTWVRSSMSAVSRPMRCSIVASKAACLAVKNSAPSSASSSWLILRRRGGGPAGPVSWGCVPRRSGDP